MESVGILNKKANAATGVAESPTDIESYERRAGGVPGDHRRHVCRVGDGGRQPDGRAAWHAAHQADTWPKRYLFAIHHPARR